MCCFAHFLKFVNKRQKCNSMHPNMAQRMLTSFLQGDILTCFIPFTLSAEYPECCVQPHQGGAIQI